MSDKKQILNHAAQELDTSGLLGFEQLRSASVAGNPAATEGTDELLHAAGRILSKKGNGEVA